MKRRFSRSRLPQTKQEMIVKLPPHPHVQDIFDAVSPLRKGINVISTDLLCICETSSSGLCHYVP